MPEKNKVDCGEGCFVCGDDMILYTEVEQPKDAAPGTWLAMDGDDVKCPKCGIQIPTVNIDDQTKDSGYPMMVVVECEHGCGTFTITKEQ